MLHIGSRFFKVRIGQVPPLTFHTIKIGYGFFKRSIILAARLSLPPCKFQGQQAGLPFQSIENIEGKNDAHSPDGAIIKEPGPSAYGHTQKRKDV